MLSSIMGIDIRSTMDIDANITGVNFDLSEIQKMINTIVNISIDDGVTFEIEKSEPIKEDNEYGGYKFKIIAQYSNLIIPFFIDISTGDVITPRAINYQYKKILEDSFIELYTYNNETILAEKLETVLKRNVANSRMKDYYDIYYFANNKWEEIDKALLKKAILKTFQHRNSENELENRNNIISDIFESDHLRKFWKEYQVTHSYAKNISFEDTINAIKTLFKI